MLGISVATLTTWGLRLAIAAPVIALVLLALFRFGVMDFRLPLLGVALAVLLAIVALLMGVMALIGGYGGDGVYTQKAVIAVVLAVVVLYAPLSTLRKG
ncbi:MAG: hypothetical protein HOK33_08820, partial [Rhodobiaceae bacterium]|nr:hypothetical protein [Rhodobiaceae bacterium]